MPKAQLGAYMPSFHAGCVTFLANLSITLIYLAVRLRTITQAHLNTLRFACMQSGVKSLAHLLSRAGMDNLLGVYESAAASEDRDEAKKLDVIAVRSITSCKL